MTKPMKLARSLSYRVEAQRNCFSLVKKRSLTLRALYHDVIDQIDVDEHNTNVKQSGQDPAGVVACGLSGLCPVARRGRGSIGRPIPEQVGSRILASVSRISGRLGSRSILRRNRKMHAQRARRPVVGSRPSLASISPKVATSPGLLAKCINTFSSEGGTASCSPLRVTIPLKRSTTRNPRRYRRRRPSALNRRSSATRTRAVRSCPRNGRGR